MFRAVNHSIVLATLLVACAPGKGGSEGSESSESGGASESGSETSTPTTRGAATEPTTGAVSCEQYMSSADFGPSLQLTVQYKSEGAEPVWIEAEFCGGLPRILLSNEFGQPLLQTTSDGGSKLCDELISAGSECEIGGEDCAAPKLLRLDPGTSITINRPAIQFTELQMTAECAPGTNCQGACLRAEPLAAATYAVGVFPFSTCVGECECDDAPVNGWCRVSGAAEPGEMLSVFATELIYPDTMEATVVIEVP